MGCGCGGSRQAALDRQQQSAQQVVEQRNEAIAAAEANPGQGMYWQGPNRTKAKA